MKTTFNRKKLTNLVFIVLLVLLLVPQTRLPIQVTINRLFANFVSPSELDQKDQKTLRITDWRLLNNNGDEVNFNDFEGKVILINFWATWCPPCIAEMPSFQKLVDHYESNEDVVFLFISNEERSTVRTFFDKNDYNFNNYQAISEYPEEFDVSTIPRTFLIGRTGNLVLDKTGAANWNSDAMIALIDSQLEGFE